MVIKNVEELKELSLGAGEVVELLGYYSKDDGATHRRIIANEDNGSGIELRNGLWANLIDSERANASWFGAKGDGVSDDGEAINKAIKYSKVVFLDSNKTYATTTTIQVGPEQKMLTSDATVERATAKIKYIGEKDNKKAVVIVGANQVGQTHLYSTANAFTNIQIDANNLCGIGVYSAYLTNESNVKNIFVVGTLEYGMYFGKSWYATYTNLTTKNNYGNGIAFGMELRFSDGSVLIGEDDLIEANGVYIDNVRAQFCGLEADNQDYKYGYGIGVGQGFELTLNKLLTESCGIGILIKRKKTYIFKVEDFYCEKNKVGVLLDTRNVDDKDVLVGTVRNGYISGDVMHINGDNKLENNGGILFDKIYVSKESTLPNVNIVKLRDCNYLLNSFNQPSSREVITGMIVDKVTNANLKDEGASFGKLGLYPYGVGEFKMWIYSNKEYEANVCGFDVKDCDGKVVGSYDINFPIKKGVNFVASLPCSSRTFELKTPANSDILVDLVVTTDMVSNY